MIATHSSKTLNSRLKQSALVSELSGIPVNAICSATTIMRKVFWACPNNAADMKYWREVIEATDHNLVPTELPGITEPYLKQMLLPINAQNDEYVSVTPVLSLGLMSEVFLRLKEQSLPYRSWTIQPTPAAMANHGEALLMQSGKVSLLRRGVAKIEQGEWRGDFVQLTARCEKINVSSGMLAIGFPAITAIGGFVHSLERELNVDIDFAFGLRSVDWINGVVKVQHHSNSYGSFNGRVKGSLVKAKPGYVTDEITANSEVVILFRTQGSLDALVAKLNNKHRLAGGQLFDLEVIKVIDGKPIKASYLLDASRDVARLRDKEGIDNLQVALLMYGMGGEWRGSEWFQPKRGYTLNHTGYGFLEKPKERDGSRGNYPHAWVESTHSLVTQGSMSDSGWWSLSAQDGGFFWQGK